MAGLHYSRAFGQIGVPKQNLLFIAPDYRCAANLPNDKMRAVAADEGIAIRAAPNQSRLARTINQNLIAFKPDQVFKGDTFCMVGIPNRQAFAQPEPPRGQIKRPKRKDQHNNLGGNFHKLHVSNY